MAKEGKLEEVDADIYVRCYNQLKRIKKDHPAPVDGLDYSDAETPHRWIWGPAGTGKTRSVWLEYPDLYPKMANKWWDGYQGEETVLIDDFDKRHEPLIHHLKVWAQQAPFLAEEKVVPKRFALNGLSSRVIIIQISFGVWRKTSI